MRMANTVCMTHERHVRVHGLLRLPQVVSTLQVRVGGLFASD